MVVAIVQVHRDSLRITAGNDAGTRRSTDARRYAKMGELPSLRRHAVEVRGPMNLGTERLNVAVAEIIAKDDDKIRRAFFCFCQLKR